MKEGLIIQGPLFSPGFGPYEFQSDGSFRKSWIDFDCMENVLTTIQSAKNYFDHIVLVTWYNAQYSDFIKLVGECPQVEVIVLKESAMLSKSDKNGVHKYHQVETLRAGSAKLEELGCDVVAKIRTDHSLNLDLLSKQVHLHRRRNVKSLGVPNINLFELDRLTDFYFVGRPEIIRGISENYLSSPEICADTHKDYFLSFLHFLSKDVELVKNIQFSDSILKRDYYCIIAWTRFYYPLPSGMFKNFHWRGKVVSYRLNGWIRWFYAFHEVQKGSRSLKFQLNLLSILTARQLKRPTIRFTSAVLFRIYRKKALKSFISKSTPH